MPESEIRYLIVRDAAGRVHYAGRGVVEYPDADEPAVREDLVAKAKAAIDAGTCITVGKLEMAADRIVDQFTESNPKRLPNAPCPSGRPHKPGVDGRCLLCSIQLL